MMLASQFNEMRVYAAGMKMIGKVKDQVIDPHGYALTDLVVRLGKESARRIFGKRFALRGTSVRVPVSAVEKIGDGVILQYTVDQLEQHIQKI